MKKIQLIITRSFAAVALMMLFVSCEKDLEITPKDDDDFTSEIFFQNPNSYKQFLAKIYGGLALTGQSNEAGNSDLGDPNQGAVDEGFSQYVRGYWQLQELPTDEAIIAWTDPSLPDLNFGTWNADNRFTESFFARVFFQVGLCNEFLRETTDAKLSSRNVSAELQAQIRVFRAEVRFLRAFSYYHGIDLFGKLPFATDADALGNPPPMQSREFIYDFIMAELEAIDADLLAPRSNEYARVDKVAAWMLKSKMLINSKVFTGVNRDSEALTAINQVIGSGYQIAAIPYANLFKADNNKNGAESEVIFPIAYDAMKTRSFGGTTFLMKASNTVASGAIIGVNDGWQGFRTRLEFVNTVSSDFRVIFQGNSDPASIEQPATFAQGRKLYKFSNKNSDGTSAQNEGFGDCDFPLFRLADAYLMYAELAANGVGDVNTAVGYVNTLRARGNISAPQISAAQLTPDLVLSERAKELYWEGHRRQDLIRFGKFTSGYTWQWKGGVQAGTDLADYKKLYAIPNKELNSNPNLSQNPGY